MLLPSPRYDTQGRREVFAALKARLNGAAASISIEPRIPSALPALDGLLGGGFPYGTLVMLEGSFGRWSIAARLVAQVTAAALAAVVDDGELYPPALAQAGARLDRVLVVPARTPLAAVRAADVLVRSRACRLVLMPAVTQRDAIWTRLAGLAHRTGVLLVVVSSASRVPLAAAGVRLHCRREHLAVRGARGHWCTFSGYGVCAELRKNRGGAAAGASARIRAEKLADAAVC